MYYTHDRCKAAWDEEKNDSYLGDSYSKIDEWGDYWIYWRMKKYGSRESQLWILDADLEPMAFNLSREGRVL